MWKVFDTGLLKKAVGWFWIHDSRLRGTWSVAVEEKAQ